MSQSQSHDFNEGKTFTLWLSICLVLSIVHIDFNYDPQ